MVNQDKSVAYLFEHALALKGPERAAFLDEACSSSPSVRAMVEGLLADDAKAGDFLNAPLFRNLKTSGLLEAETRDTGLQTSDGPSRPGGGSGGRFQEGDVLAGRFKIVRYIAQGGMGEVYEVEDRQLQGVRLALKTILSHIADSPDMQERFEREVLLARRVVHPNLCPIYDIFHCQHEGAKLTFLTMKLLSGETLSERLRRDGAIELPEAAQIVQQVGAALDAAHDAGILHRDIKTANIMLDGSGVQVRAYVTDFGLARAYQNENTALTIEGVAGTPGYVAPELFQGATPSKASDVYAFGVVVYKMLTGYSPPLPADPRAKAIRDPFVEKLPLEWRRLLEGCLEPSVGRRWQSVPEALAALHSERTTRSLVASVTPQLSRRRLIVLGVGAAGATVGGVWMNWPRINFALHPLPTKRFVALLGWPSVSDARVAPMITAVVDAISSELTRAEAYDHNLFIIPHQIGTDVASLSQLNEVRESLGANLVLAASGVPGARGIQVLLQVLDPAASRILREEKLNVRFDEELSLPQKAVRLAAELLSIGSYKSTEKQNKLGTDNRDAFNAFQSGEAARKQENDAGLEEAMEKYKQAIELDPHFAEAHAKLSWAYLRSYGLHSDQAALELARRNCQAAIRLNPDLVDAHIGLAWIHEQTGELEAASHELGTALSLDPGNPRTLVYQAKFYGANNKWKEAEETFQRVLSLRPNFWLAHQELGVILDLQGKYEEALTEFGAASLAAPRNALALKNVGSVYLQLGKVDEALTSLNASYKLKVEDNAAVTLSEAYRVQRNYPEAISYALKSVNLNANEPDHWLQLGDCYISAGKPQSEAEAAYRKAVTAQEEKLKDSPKDGPGWMLLALCRIKAGQPDTAMGLVTKAESLFADDMDSQLWKVRILALLGKTDAAFATASRCKSRGATAFQFESMPDLKILRTDPRYQPLIKT